jgi:hypothetical protein
LAADLKLKTKELRGGKHCFQILPTSVKNKDNDDRLKRNLTLDDFITAFGRYKKIMCSAFPNRAEELDAYLAHIVETARVWPQKFYEYHHCFQILPTSVTSVDNVAEKTLPVVGKRSLLCVN